MNKLKKYKGGIIEYKNVEKNTILTYITKPSTTRFLARVLRPIKTPILHPPTGPTFNERRLNLP